MCRYRLWLYMGSVIIACWSCVGCGGADAPDPTTAVAVGLATVDGKPITGGTIMFLAFDDPRQRASSSLSPEGTFRVDRAPIGKCRVVIDNSAIKGFAPTYYVPVPSKYQSFSKTDLVVELEPGMNRDVAVQCGS